ncbi:hypothetical protein HELRODRAFT_184387 [Helobdella robusta]|uniref:HTH psq-type domain-containing protein n=1 Tax=Helobdella robusta TaxID=6412 RepID=T1FL38_HELRO|nr:hypothetical protein HELRODRAFT_184387 [Helobdella robusta]ESN99674.1 hypothetical protein HELRODRAFT_184387 [Helobdella robusta]
MVRYRERKTNRGKTPVEVMRTAVDEVLKKNRAINAVACETGIDRMTLKRYVRKSSLSPSVGLIPNWNTRQVFNLEQEEMLAKYLLQASKMNYGLSTKTTRQICSDHFCNKEYKGYDGERKVMLKKAFPCVQKGHNDIVNNKPCLGLGSSSSYQSPLQVESILY